MLTRDDVLRGLSYDAAQGKFFWRYTYGRKLMGAQAGWVNHNGYRVIGIQGKKIMAHKLVWLMEHGVLPAGEIDHINRMPDDNRATNLREADRHLNMRNRNANKNNPLGMKGVVKHQNGFRARIMHKGVLIDLGVFFSAKEAAIAYSAAEKVCEIFCQVGI